MFLSLFLDFVHDLDSWIADFSGSFPASSFHELTVPTTPLRQATEDGFQRIREVTGLTDVMDIVHKRRGVVLCRVYHHRVRVVDRRPLKYMHVLYTVPNNHPKWVVLVLIVCFGRRGTGGHCG